MRSLSRVFLAISVSAVLCGAGCVAVPAISTPDSAQLTNALGVIQDSLAQPSAPAEWVSIDQGVERLEAALSGGTVVLYRFPRASFSMRVVNDSVAPKRVSEWLAAFPDAFLVINGAYFHEDNSPSGFLAANGTRVGSRQFDMARSGTVVLQPELRIVHTAKEPLALDSVTDGFQSFPFYISDGQPAISEDSGLVARRTFLGTDTDDRVYVGVLSSGVMSLHALMRELDALDIVWDDVLNLDGGPSTGLAVRSVDSRTNETLDSILPVSSAVIVELKK